MSKDSFEDRINRIGAKSVTANGNSKINKKRTKPHNNSSSYTGVIVAGILWGIAFAHVIVFLNKNYDLLKESSESLLIALTGFTVISLLILAVMIVAGIILGLLGRTSPKRWRFLLGFAVGLGGGTQIAQMLIS